MLYQRSPTKSILKRLNRAIGSRGALLRFVTVISTLHKRHRSLRPREFLWNVNVNHTVIVAPRSAAI